MLDRRFAQTDVREDRRELDDDESGIDNPELRGRDKAGQHREDPHLEDPAADLAQDIQSMPPRVCCVRWPSLGIRPVCSISSWPTPCSTHRSCSRRRRSRQCIPVSLSAEQAGVVVEVPVTVVRCTKLPAVPVELLHTWYPPARCRPDPWIIPTRARSSSFLL